MSDLAEQESAVPPLLRDRSGVQRVTNIELFFDLVYVFAVTQLSHYLIGHSTVAGALQTGLLLAMVWLVWSYTTWVTNWLDPEQMAVRAFALAGGLAHGHARALLWLGAVGIDRHHRGDADRREARHRGQRDVVRRGRGVKIPESPNRRLDDRRTRNEARP
jgi:low temperature requirement protein LtrA